MYAQQSGLRFNSKIQLTGAGADLYDSQRMDGSSSGEVLTYLHDNGASRVFSIADGVDLDDASALRIVQQLARNGYVEEATEESPSTGELSNLD